MVELGQRRVAQLQANGFPKAVLYDPQGVGGTSVVTVLAHGDHPEWYGLPGRSPRSAPRQVLEERPAAARRRRDLRRRHRGVRRTSRSTAARSVERRRRPGRRTSRTPRPRRGTMSAVSPPRSVDSGRRRGPDPRGRRRRQRDRPAQASPRADSLGRSRRRSSVRLFTGMPIWTPLFGWMAQFFGGLSVCRVVHPWVGLAFFVASAVMFVEWHAEMTLEPQRERAGGAAPVPLHAVRERRTRTSASTTAARNSISGVVARRARRCSSPAWSCGFPAAFPALVPMQFAYPHPRLDVHPLCRRRRLPHLPRARQPSQAPSGR